MALVCDKCKSDANVRAVRVQVDSAAGFSSYTASMAMLLAETDLTGQDYSVDLCAPCREQLLNPLLMLSPQGRLRLTHWMTVPVGT